MAKADARLNFARAAAITVIVGIAAFISSDIYLPLMFPAASGEKTLSEHGYSDIRGGQSVSTSACSSFALYARTYNTLNDNGWPVQKTVCFSGLSAYVT